MNREFIYSQTAQYIISNNILAPLQHVRNWTGERAAPPPPPLWGGGGGWNAIRFKILDPLKISDITPPKKSKYQISRIHKNQISGLKNQISDPPKKYQNSRYPRFTPPPPHSVTPCDEVLQPRYVASRYRYVCVLEKIITPCDFQMLACHRESRTN